MNGRLTVFSGAWRRPCGMAAAVGAVLTLRRWAGEFSGFDAVTYRFIPAPRPAGWLPWIILAALAAAVFARTPKHWGEKLAPALLYYPLLVLPAMFGSLAATLALTGWCLFRLLPGKSVRFPLPRKAAATAAALLSLATAAWSFAVQEQAFRALFLAGQDWGEYAESYLRLAGGGVPWRDYLSRAGHFNLLPNLVMTLLMRIHPAPETIFVVSALLLGALPLLSYMLARNCRLPAASSLLCAAATALNPVLINQSLSLFYGFHPVLFQGPLLLGFFIMERRRNKLGMATFFALSMLVQETAAVLWLGFALYLLLRRRYRIGALLAVGCVGFFALATVVVMPYVYGDAVNPQLFHYAQLGGTPPEILLSPVLRPAAFFSTLLQKQNWYFTAAVLLPVLFLFLLRGLPLLLPLWAGVVMQESPDVKNPAMQYGFELSVLCAALAAYRAGELLRGHRSGTLRAGLRTTAALSLLCALYWGKLPVGQYSTASLFGLPDATAVLNSLRQAAGDGGRLLATRRLRTHFMFDRPAAPLAAARRTGDAVILDLHDPLEPVEEFRRGLVNDETAIPVYSVNFHGSVFAVWRIAPPGTTRPALPFLRMMSESEFSGIGIELPQENPSFAARLARTPHGGTLLLIRLRRRVHSDVEILLELRQNGRNVARRLRFGDGVYPAYRARPGEVYLAALPGAFPERAELRISATE